MVQQNLKKESRSIKIAILGNMNNNGFAVMRYFRDLGADAHLFLYANDGVGCLAHFTPENDCFDINKWQDYIHKTLIDNGPHQVLPGLARWLYVNIYNAKNARKPGLIKLKYQSDYTTCSLFADFDAIIVSGFGAIHLMKIGLSIKIFYPYCAGVEGIHRQFAPPWRRLLIRTLWEVSRRSQICALKKSENVINSSDQGMTAETLDRNSIKYTNLSIPMLYVNGYMNDVQVGKGFDMIAEQLLKCDISFLVHGRQLWLDETCKTTGELNKNLHWVLHAISKIKKKRNTVRIKCCIVEYGLDVESTKALAEELCINEEVIWLPKTNRKTLMWLLGKVTIGVGEFIQKPRQLWGGTGWEVMAAGKPLLQSFYFTDDEFIKIYGHEAPPILKVSSPDDIVSHTIRILDDPSISKSIGADSKRWFNKYNGIKMAEKWLAMAKFNKARA
jgi:hypothetical protein